MKSIDLTPLYRNSIGFDRLANMLDSAMSADAVSNGYPPYNIEALDESTYAIVLAVAGFDQDELDIMVEKGVLTVSGKKAADTQRNYLYHGIADRSFERKFNLADYVEVTDADLSNGLLTVKLMKEIPEAMKPRSIAINQGDSVIEHKAEKKGGKAA
ncbi:MAG: Hsp20 family protein [Gammaproteobacteria bacterium]|nr:Hsp20 family protein [Gammaproteobacteria bacterium]